MRDGPRHRTTVKAGNELEADDTVTHRRGVE